MDYIKDAPAMASIISKVAWVNINKMPASNGSVSPASNIREAKVKYINLLKEQIDLLAPDIVICGNTFQFIEKEFGSPQPHNFDSAEKFVPHYVINNTLWIDPFHPGYAGRGFVDMGLYINDIIRTIKKYFNSYQ